MIGIRRMCYALVALALLSVPFPAHAQSRPCEQWSFGESVGPKPVTEIVPAIPDTSIWVCGVVMAAGGSGTIDFQLFAGSGTDCGTDQQALTPPVTLNAGAPPLVNRGNTPIEHTPIGYALCGLSSAKSQGTLDWIIYWTRF